MMQSFCFHHHSGKLCREGHFQLVVKYDQKKDSQMSQIWRRFVKASYFRRPWLILNLIFNQKFNQKYINIQTLTIFLIIEILPYTFFKNGKIILSFYDFQNQYQITIINLFKKEKMNQQRRNFYLSPKTQQSNTILKKHVSSKNFVKFERTPTKRTQASKNQFMVKSVKEIMNPNTSEDSYFLFDLKQNNAVQKKIQFCKQTSKTPLQDNKTSEKHSLLDFKLKKNYGKSEKNISDTFQDIFSSFQIMILDLKKIMEKFHSLFNESEIFEHFVQTKTIKLSLEDIQQNLNSKFQLLMSCKPTEFDLLNLEKILKKNQDKRTIVELENDIQEEKKKNERLNERQGKKRKFSSSEHDLYFIRNFFNKDKEEAKTNPFEQLTTKFTQPESTKQTVQEAYGQSLDTTVFERENYRVVKQSSNPVKY